MSTTTVSAFPSKSFFVSTLTRDIELKDAILDLLDNCVDGILRHSKKHHPKNEKKPYNDYEAKITLSSKFFSIEDNCGGISKNLLEKSAFRLGRVENDRDLDLPTVGMYGIGMKRAIFKMGEAASVITMHEGETYSVDIKPEWLKDDDNWKLPLEKIKNVFQKDGTRVTVNNLYENIAARFRSKDFIEDLQKDIANFFAIVIDKGFNVYINEEKIRSADFSLLSPESFSASPEIQPYAYEGDIDGVNVKIVVGFYRELPKVEDVTNAEEDEREIPTKTSDNAGWTVICNDRVILYRNKDRLTGWGVRDVPKYHTQFIAIAGVVIFQSNNSLKLPLGTTKTNLDLNSSIYGLVLNNMMEGLKQFTNFTNRWKGREKETVEDFKKMRRIEPVEIISKIPKDQWKTVRNSNGKERKFIPSLPRPEKTKENRRIAFYRPADEISLLGEYYFGDSETLPSEVGERCFKESLKIAKRG